MNNKLFRALQFALVFAIAFVWATGAYALNIDDFDDTAQSIFTFSAPPIVDNTGSTAASEAVGGHRLLEILTANGLTQLAADTAPALDRLSLSNGAGVISTSRVTWDANGAGLGGGSGVDMTDAGASTFFSLDVVSIDQGNVDITITVDDGINTPATTTISNATPNTTVQRQFASFTNYQLTIFENAISITLDISAGDASDLTLDLVYTSGAIPEPSTVILFAVGGLGMLGYAWRRRKAASQ